jgi:putative ABC transport system substrate-binding protein
MVAAGNPVEIGLVASLARPGGNITGHSILAPEIVGKQLELLKESVPRLSRVAVLRNPAQPPHAAMSREAEVAARALGMRLKLLEVRGPDDFDSAFAAMTRERVGGLLVLADAMFVLHRTRLADLAAKSRLPAMYGFTEHVEAGGLMAYAPSVPDLFRRAATYVAKILGGARPADLPVEQPMRFELVVNLKTAKALGLTIPQSVLFRADQVIQ